MIRSLVARLLRQFPFPTVQADPSIPPEAIRKGDVGHICRFFVSLMQQLQPGTTVFYITNGIDHYERENYLPCASWTPLTANEMFGGGGG